MRRVVRFLACSLFAVLLPTFCHADPILTQATANVGLEAGVPYPRVYCSPPPSGTISCSTTPGGLTLSYSGDATGVVSGSDQYGTDPAVSSGLTLSGILDPMVQYRSQSTVDYQFYVSGPANQTVAVTVAGTGSSSVNHLAPNGELLTAEGFLSVYTAGGPELLVASTCAGSPFGSPCFTTNRSDSFSVDDTLNISTDTVYDVQVLTDVLLRSESTIALSPPDLSASATVDPTITLDTTDPAYSLDFSPAPVPEPSTILLSAPCLAFGLLALQRRRRDLTTG